MKLLVSWWPLQTLHPHCWWKSMVSLWKHLALVEEQCLFTCILLVIYPAGAKAINHGNLTFYLHPVQWMDKSPSYVSQGQLRWWKCFYSYETRLDFITWEKIRNYKSHSTCLEPQCPWKKLHHVFRITYCQKAKRFCFFLCDCVFS